MDLFELPAVQPNKHVEKRLISDPDLSLLLDSQYEVFKSLNIFMKSGERFMRVRGKAGVGKTFLISMFIEYYLFNNPHTPVCICAPTNKAVRVSNTMSQYENGSISYKTNHSVLGIRMKREHGKEVFIQSVKPTVNNFKMIGSDEASMLHPYITELMDGMCANKVIFIGDPNQLPPVIDDSEKEYWLVKGYPVDISPIWSMPMNEVTMDTIVRQAQGNPIITLANLCTEKPYVPLPDFNAASNVIDGKLVGVFQFNKRSSDDYEMFLELILNYFLSDNYRQDFDFCRVVCFTNEEVNRYNKFIRKHYFKGIEEKIAVGERLIVSDSIKDLEYEPQYTGDEHLLFNVNDELEVISYTIESLDIGRLRLNYYEAKVIDLNKPYSPPKTINIIHESSEDILKKTLNTMAAMANNAKGIQKSRYWEAFYQLKDLFAVVMYGYASTIHKSQGSTIKYVFYDKTDEHYVKDSSLLRRLQYTAVTRASSVLMILY